MESNNLYYINILHNNKHYRIQSLWNDYNIKLTIIDEFRTFKADINKESLKKLAVKYEKSNFEEYVEDLRTCLSQTNTSKYLYYRNNNRFLLSKLKDDIKVQIADFTLTEVDFKDTLLELVDEIAEFNLFYQKELQQIKNDLDIAIIDKTNYLNKLEEYAYKKKNMEHELYSKFILILNEKKRYIQFLQEIIKSNGQDELEMANKFDIKMPERISDSDSEDTLGESSHQIIHDVEVEHHNMSPKKKLEMSSEDENYNKAIKLPKRVRKIDESNTDSITVVSRNYDEITTELTKTENADENHTEIKEEASFNTQDLFDLL